MSTSIIELERDLKAKQIELRESYLRIIKANDDIQRYEAKVTRTMACRDVIGQELFNDDWNSIGDKEEINKAKQHLADFSRFFHAKVTHLNGEKARLTETLSSRVMAVQAARMNLDSARAQEKGETCD